MGFTLNLENSQKAQLLSESSHQVVANKLRLFSDQINNLSVIKDTTSITTETRETLSITIMIPPVCMMTDGFTLSLKNSKKVQLLSENSHQVEVSKLRLFSDQTSNLFVNKEDQRETLSIMIQLLEACTMINSNTLLLENLTGNSLGAQKLDTMPLKPLRKRCQLSPFTNTRSITSITDMLRILSIMTQLPLQCTMMEIRLRLTPLLELLTGNSLVALKPNMMPLKLPKRKLHQSRSSLNTDIIIKEETHSIMTQQHLLCM